MFTSYFTYFFPQQKRKWAKKNQGNDVKKSCTIFLNFKVFFRIIFFKKTTAVSCWRKKRETFFQSPHMEWMKLKKKNSFLFPRSSPCNASVSCEHQNTTDSHSRSVFRMNPTLWNRAQRKKKNKRLNTKVDWELNVILYDSTLFKVRLDRWEWGEMRARQKSSSDFSYSEGIFGLKNSLFGMMFMNFSKLKYS
jgi:hypothetical protein